MKKIIFLLFIAVLACTKSSGPSKNDGPKDLDSITIGIAQEPDTLFSPFKEMMASEEVFRVGNYTLTIYDEDWKLVPWSAKRIPTLENGDLKIYKENGRKKMKAVWHIRDDFFWADGKPLVADDFILAHKINMDPTQEVVDRSTDEKIEKMESVGTDGKTLVVTWKEPYAYYHNYRQHDAVPKHIIGPIFETTPDKLKKHEFGREPLLAGAFTIKKWVPGNHIVAEVNKFAKGYAPKLKEVIWKIIPQTNTLESNLVSGGIDAISSVGMNVDMALQFEKRHGDKYDFDYTPGLLWEHIDYNLDNPILKDKRVRQALAYGANREGIAKALFDGRQPVAHGTEPEKSQYYNPNIKKYPFDPKAAEKLLDEAGWKLPKPGAIRQKDGKPLELELMTTSGNKTREKVEQLLQAQWRRIGVDIQIKNQPAKVFFGETLRHRKYKAMAMYSWVKDPLTVSETLWRCDYIPRKENNYMGQNQPGWCNKTAHDLVVEASTELNEKKRQAIGKKFEAIWAEELPALPLFFRVDVTVTKKGLKNWKPTGTLQPITWNAHEWQWEKPKKP